jgi:hypothetical protein
MGKDMVDNVGDDVGNRVDGGNATGKGDSSNTNGEGGEGAPGGGRGNGGGRSVNGGSCGCILQGLFAFYCEDIFVWYFNDMWGDLARSHLPSHSRHA